MPSSSIESLVPASLRDFVAIISDYDRTLTDESLKLWRPAIEALKSLREKREIKIVIASGRRLSFLLEKLDSLNLVDAFIAENGAVVHIPKSNITSTFNKDMSQVKAALNASSVPTEEGDVVVSTKRAFEKEVKRILRERGLRMGFHYNRDALMILPAGVSKATGVLWAGSELGLSTGGLICIGDAENDLPLFEIASVRVAPEDAIPEVKNKADVVCTGVCGLGVTRFLNDLLTGNPEISLHHNLRR